MRSSLSRWQAVALGLVVCCGLGLAGTGLYAVGSRQWLWGNTFRVRVGFPQIRGVEIGTKVRVQGVEAGEVEAIETPLTPGQEVMLRLRLDGKLRHLVRADARVQIVAEGMLGSKVLEVLPGSPQAEPVANDGLLTAAPSRELTDLLGDVSSTLQAIRDGEGSLSKLLKDPEAHAALVAMLKQGQETLRELQQDAEAVRRLPLVRSYVEDHRALLIRPNCERNRQYFAAEELFEADSAILTLEGKQRLDALVPWLKELNYKGSEIVVAAYADPARADPVVARILTRQQSEAVLDYLKRQHRVQKLGWFSSRKVTALGHGTAPPPLPDTEALPASRVEVLVFIPRS